MIYGIGVRLVAAALSLALSGWGGWLYRGYTDAQRAASQAVEASVKSAASALKRDSQSLSDRRSAIAKTEPTLATLRGWQGGLHEWHTQMLERYIECSVTHALCAKGLLE